MEYFAHGCQANARSTRVIENCQPYLFSSATPLVLPTRTRRTPSSPFASPPFTSSNMRDHSCPCPCPCSRLCCLLAGFQRWRWSASAHQNPVRKCGYEAIIIMRGKLSSQQLPRLSRRKRLRLQPPLQTITTPEFDKSKNVSTSESVFFPSYLVSCNIGFGLVLCPTPPRVQYTLLTAFSFLVSPISPITFLSFRNCPHTFFSPRGRFRLLEPHLRYSQCFPV